MATLAVQIGGQAGNFVMHLLAAHDQRVAEAKSENAAVSAALSALVHDFGVIVYGFNTGEMTVQSAIASAQNVDGWYWAYVSPLSQYKNASPSSCNPSQLGPNAKLSAKGTRCWQSTQSGLQFTAADYMGCNIVDAVLGDLIAALQSLSGKPSGSSAKVNICPWPTNKYGLQAYSGSSYVLTVPKVVSQQEVTISQAGILSLGAPPSQNAVIVSQGAIVGASVTGIAGLLSGTRFSPSLFVVAIIAVALFLAFGGRRA